MHGVEWHYLSTAENKINSMHAHYTSKCPRTPFCTAPVLLPVGNPFRLVERLPALSHLNHFTPIVFHLKRSCSFNNFEFTPFEYGEKEFFLLHLFRWERSKSTKTACYLYGNFSNPILACPPATNIEIFLFFPEEKNQQLPNPGETNLDIFFPYLKTSHSICGAAVAARILKSFANASGANSIEKGKGQAEGHLIKFRFPGRLKGNCIPFPPV
ncbi:hypothetical protein CDAR_440631 [Caerostris darwini]|uniref:Uncharacterized protein n=1 Tax=Caerostris darwini TaxID=1538125 RepID=A0AAV4MLA7_9ARAC|nr:hypothetical protein CDAR_440631 [Caerostris darwini]